MINDPRQAPQGNPSHPQQRPTAYPPPPRPVGAPHPAGAPPQVRSPMSAPTPIGLNDADLEPISLVEEATDGMAVAPGAPPPKKIVAFGSDVHHNQRQWKRPLHSTGTGATRVKSFHGKYSEQGLEYLDNAINAWLDSNTDVEVKFVTSTVMTFEGKIREPALVLNVWY